MMEDGCGAGQVVTEDFDGLKKCVRCEELDPPGKVIDCTVVGTLSLPLSTVTTSDKLLNESNICKPSVQDTRISVGQNVSIGGFRIEKVNELIIEGMSMMQSAGTSAVAFLVCGLVVSLAAMFRNLVYTHVSFISWKPAPRYEGIAWLLLCIFLLLMEGLSLINTSVLVTFWRDRGKTRLLKFASTYLDINSYYSGNDEGEITGMLKCTPPKRGYGVKETQNLQDPITIPYWILGAIQCICFLYYIKLFWKSVNFSTAGPNRISWTNSSSPGGKSKPKQDTTKHAAPDAVLMVAMDSSTKRTFCLQCENTVEPHHTYCFACGARLGGG